MPLPLDLNINLKDIDTRYPSIAVGSVRAEIKKWEVAENAKGGHRLVLALETCEPTNDTEGKELAAGHKFNTNLNLPDSPSGAEQNDRNEKGLASMFDAVFHTSKDAGDRPDFNEDTLNALVGKQVNVVVKKKKEEDEFGSTQVSGFKPVQQ